MRFDARTLRFSTAELGAFGASHAAVREIFASFAASGPETVSFYGAGFACGSSAFAVLGSSGIGKSVLSLEIARAGAQFLGDETLVLELSGGLIRALPRYPALREPSLRFLADPLRRGVLAAPYAAAFAGGRFWYALLPRHLTGIGPDPSPHPLAGVIVIRGRAERPSLRPIPPDALLEAAIGKLYFKPQSVAEVACLRAALSQVRAFELRLGAPSETAALILEKAACA